PASRREDVCRGTSQRTRGPQPELAALDRRDQAAFRRHGGEQRRAEQTRGLRGADPGPGPSTRDDAEPAGQLGQRTAHPPRGPGVFSMPSNRSRPPPSGSQSTSSAPPGSRSAVKASAAASTEAPAPPRPPTTPSTKPGGSAGVSTMSANAPARSVSSSGRQITRSTPRR